MGLMNPASLTRRQLCNQLRISSSPAAASLSLGEVRWERGTATEGRKEAFEEETQEAAAADAVGKVGEDGGSEGGGGGCWLGGGSFRRGEG